LAVSTTIDNLSPRAREIATAARELLEERGSGGLSMRTLAKRLGMRAPSIYKHFSSKEALEAVLISVGFAEQAALFRSALNTSREPLIAMGAAYREFARENPQLYRLMYDRALNRSLVIAGTEEAAAAPSIEATGGDEDLARAAWAFAHGMAILELNDRFTPGADLDAAWKRGLATLQGAVRGRKRNTPRRAGSGSGRGR
jgi:AcrR family transcriptional regulator